MTTIHPDDQTVIDATRIWLEKAVIGLNLCPFAKAVYVKNQIRYVVSHARHTDQFLEELDSELERLANTDPEEIDTTLLIHPFVSRNSAYSTTCSTWPKPPRKPSAWKACCKWPAFTRIFSLPTPSRTTRATTQPPPTHLH